MRKNHQADAQAYALPIKLKYDCPPASKFGDDPPLWKTALTTFVPVLELVVEATESTGEAIPLKFACRAE